MHGHYEDITKVDLLLTEPSQMTEVGPGEDEQRFGFIVTVCPDGTPNASSKGADSAAIKDAAGSRAAFCWPKW